MKRYGHLYEKITSFANLLLAAKKALKGKKDKNRAAEFYFNLENEIIEIQRALEYKTYRPKPIRTFIIMEPKVREIGASEFSDRVVHHAVCNVIEPVFEKSYIHQSYACRKGRGLHAALKQAQRYCRAYEYFLKLDIRKYFGSIDHHILKRMLERKFKDPDLLWLLDIMINSLPAGDKGIPIGSLTSQHFANFYLDKLDHYIKESLGVSGYLRYMDDFILFGNQKEELHVFKSKISRFLEEELHLQLKEKACLLAPCMSGVPFLGFRLFPGLIRLKQENKRRSLRKLKKRNREYGKGKIDEAKYARSLMSITEHLKTANSYHLRRDVFSKMFR